MTIYYTSDLHLFHDKVADVRGYKDGDEWACVVDEYMRGLNKRDHVWFLGDMTGGGRINEMLDMVSRWPGTKHLVTGNHDPAWPANRDSRRYLRRYVEVFDTVAPWHRRRIGGRDVMLSHFPYEGDHTDEDRYSAMRLRDAGLPVLHGHTHSNLKGDARQVHVGWDAWWKVVPEEEIHRILTIGEGIV